MIRLASLVVAVLLISSAAGAAPAARLYVTDWHSTELRVIDAMTHDLIAVVPIATDAGQPVLSPDERRLYVGCSGNNQVYEIDTSTLQVLRTFQLGRNPASVAVTPDAKKLYVVNRNDHSVSSVDLESGLVRTLHTESTTGQYSVWSVTTGPGRRAYVSNYGSILVFDTATDTRLPSLPGTGGPGDLAMSPSGDRLYAADGNSGYLLVLDLATKQALAYIQGAAAHGNGLAIAPDGTRAYVTHSNTGGGVSVFDTVSLTRVNRYPTIQVYPSSVASDAGGTCLFVRSLYLVVTLRASDGDVFGTLPTPYLGNLTVSSGQASCGQQVEAEISWTPSALTFGQALSTDQLNAVANVPGAFTYTPPPGTMLNAGTHSLHAVFTPDETSAYLVTEASAMLTVARAVPQLGWATLDPIVVGTPLTNVQLAATANVNGTFFYEPAAGIVLPVGTHTLSASFSPADANYTTAGISRTIEVRYGTCLLYDPSRPVRGGSTMPLKIQLCDAAGQNRSSADVAVTAVRVYRVANAVQGELLDAGHANPDSNFRFVPELQGYIFNLQTTGLGTGVYAVDVQVATDPVKHTLAFQVK